MGKHKVDDLVDVFGKLFIADESANEMYGYGCDVKGSAGALFFKIRRMDKFAKRDVLEAIGRNMPSNESDFKVLYKRGLELFGNDGE